MTSLAIDEGSKIRSCAIALTVLNVFLLALNSYAVLVVLPIAWSLKSWAAALVVVGGPLAVATLVLSLRVSSPLRLVLVVSNLLVTTPYLFFWGLFFFAAR